MALYFFRRLASKLLIPEKCTFNELYENIINKEFNRSHPRTNRNKGKGYQQEILTERVINPREETKMSEIANKKK